MKELAVKEAKYLVGPSDDALKKNKGKKSGKKKDDKKAASSDSTVLQERAEKVLLEFLAEEHGEMLESGGDPALGAFTDSYAGCLEHFGGGRDKKEVSLSYLRHWIDR